MLQCMQLKPQIRQQLTLLLQRQHLEEQELRLRHWMELEKFHKGLGELLKATYAHAITVTHEAVFLFFPQKTTVKFHCTTL